MRYGGNKEMWLKRTNSQCKINKFRGCSVQHGDYNNVYLKVLKGVDLKSFCYQKKKIVVIVVM